MALTPRTPGTSCDGLAGFTFGLRTALNARPTNPRSTRHERPGS